VAAEIIHDDDVAWFEDRNELLLHIGAEALNVGRTVEDAGQSTCRSAGPRGKSMSANGRAGQSSVPARPSVPAQRGHAGPGLVDEDQTTAIEIGLP
jgi:hypothetical protein